MSKEKQKGTQEWKERWTKDGKKRKEPEEIQEKEDKSPSRWMQRDPLKGVPDNLHNGSD